MFKKLLNLLFILLLLSACSSDSISPDSQVEEVKISFGVDETMSFEEFEKDAQCGESELKLFVKYLEDEEYFQALPGNGFGSCTECYIQIRYQDEIAQDFTLYTFSNQYLDFEALEDSVKVNCKEAKSVPFGIKYKDINLYFIIFNDELNEEEIEKFALYFETEASAMAGTKSHLIPGAGFGTSAQSMEFNLVVYELDGKTHIEKDVTFELDNKALFDYSIQEGKGIVTIYPRHREGSQDIYVTHDGHRQKYTLVIDQ